MCVNDFHMYYSLFPLILSKNVLVCYESFVFTLIYGWLLWYFAKSKVFCVWKERYVLEFGESQILYMNDSKWQVKDNKNIWMFSYHLHHHYFVRGSLQENWLVATHF
jgi:hypothetical protein